MSDSSGEIQNISLGSSDTTFNITGLVSGVNYSISVVVFSNSVNSAALTQSYTTGIIYAVACANVLVD